MALENDNVKEAAFKRRNDASHGLMSPITNPVASDNMDIPVSFNDNAQSKQAATTQENSDALLGMEVFSSMPAPSYKAMNAAETEANLRDRGNNFIGDLYPEFGQSRLDKRIQYTRDLDNLEDFRARQQSAANKIFNGLGQAGVTAATTFADSILGTLAGVANVAVQAADGNVNSFGDALSAFVQNPLSVELQNINEKGRDLFKNYQTELERSRKWYQNIFTANFLADNIIGNAGFTIGAGYGARMATAGLAKVAGMRSVRDIYKGLVSEIGKEVRGKSASEILEGIRNGSIRMSDFNAVKQFSKAAKQLSKGEQALMLSGALMAGAGEGRIEAINAADELQQMFDETYGDLDASRDQEKAQARAELQAAYPTAFGMIVGEDGMADLAPATPEMQQIVADRMKEIDDRYDGLQSEMQHRKAKVANTVFSYNLPLLTFGDAVQFGKFILGDYAVDRLAQTGIKSAAKESIKDAMAKQGLKAGLEATMKAGVELADAGRRQGIKTAGRAVGNALTEMSEEMNQSWISSAAKDYGASKVTEFTERLLNPEAEQKTRTWLDSVREGFKESWGNTDDWVEGFCGFFMGALGLPNVRFEARKNSEGQEVRHPRVSMAGGIWEPIREARENNAERQEIVDAINRKLQDPKFLDYYYGRLGHEATDISKAAAAASGDEWAYDKANQMQFINDVVMFDKAGRIQDLHDMIDRMAAVSEDDVEDLRAMTANVKGSDVEKLTDSGLLQRVKDNAGKMQEALEQYEKVSRDIQTVYGDSLTDIERNEMVWKSVRLNLLENSLFSLVNSVASDIAPYISEYKSTHEAVADSTDYDILQSKAFGDFVQKKIDEKDTSISTELKESAKNKLADIRKGAKERDAYIDNIANTSRNPEIIQAQHERNAANFKEQERLRRLLEYETVARGAASVATLRKYEKEDGSYDSDYLEAVSQAAKDGSAVAQEFLDLRAANTMMQSEIEKRAAADGLSEADIAKAKEAWNYVYSNASSLPAALARVAPEALGNISVTDAQLKLMNDAIEAVAKFDANAKYIREAAAMAASSTKEQSRPVDTAEKLPNNILRVRIKLSPKQGIVDSNGNPVTGTYYLVIDTTKKKQTNIPYDRNGNKVNDKFVTAANNTAHAIAGIPLADVVFQLALDNSDERQLIRPNVVDPWKETMDAPSSNPPQSSSAGPIRQAPIPEATDGRTLDKFIRAYNTTPAAASVKSGDVIHFGMETKDGPIYLLHGSEVVGELPSGGHMRRVSGLYELDRQLRNEYDDAQKNANGLFISQKYSVHVRSTYKGLPLTNADIPIAQLFGIPEDITQVKFVMYTGKEDRLVQHSNADVAVLEKVQWGNTIRRSGTVYLLVPTSDGNYRPAACRQASFDKEVWDSIKDTQDGKDISASIKALFDEVMRPGSNWTTIESVKKSLGNVLYLRGERGELGFFKKDKTNELVIKEKNPDTNKYDIEHGRVSSWEGLLDTLINTVHVKFQVQRNPFLSSDKFFNTLINTGRLTINLTSFMADAPQFQMDYFVPNGEDGGSFARATINDASSPVPQKSVAEKDGGVTDMQLQSTGNEWNVNIFETLLGNAGIVNTADGRAYTWDEACNNLGMPFATELYVRAFDSGATYTPANSTLDGRRLITLPNKQVVGFNSKTGKLLSKEETDKLKQELKLAPTVSTPVSSTATEDTSLISGVSSTERRVRRSGTTQTRRPEIMDLRASLSEPTSEQITQNGNSSVSQREKERQSDCSFEL